MSKKILLPTNPCFHNLTGNIYSRLTVIQYAGKSTSKEHKWLCKCSCGKLTTVLGHSLKTGNTTSCGCYLKEVLKEKATTHGMTNQPEYKIWVAIIGRCNNPRNNNYHLYGGRGIKVCKRWLKFEKFYKDMGPRPTDKHQIDRKNNDKGYFPGNCKWVTRSENCRNKRDNFLITYKGSTKCLSAWAETLGINRRTLNNRIKRGWTIHKAFTQPVSSKSNLLPDKSS